MTAALMEAVAVSRSFARRGCALFRRRVEEAAVDKVSLALREGETVALVGESGSGKSTLGRLLLGLLPPSAGTLLYRGEDLGGLPPPARRRYRSEVQAVFQDSGASLNPRRTAGQSVAIPLLYHGGLGRAAAARRADALLETVGLDPGEFRDRWPHELSGGQRQRVNIARALGSDPSLIVADEPVSALDVSVRAQILALMARIQRSRTLAYLFITHDLGAAQALADRVVVLYRGVVMEEGPAASILAAPRHPYTQALLAARPLPDPTRRPVRPPWLAMPTSSIAGCRYSDRCPHAEDACRQAEPALRPLPGGTAARCIRA